MFKQITSQGIEEVVGFEVSDYCKALISKFNLQYQDLSKQERDRVILDVLVSLDMPLEKAGQHKLEKWEKGWAENLELLKVNKDPASLVPKYFGKHKVARWLGDFVKCETDYFEYKLHIILVDSILNHYVNQKFDWLFEFGCGPAYHLLRFREFNKAIKLVGLDWTVSSQNIIHEIGRLGITDNLTAANFNYFKPDYSVDVPKRTAVFTCASLEQVGENYREFVDFLISKKPELCINFEPLAELLNPDSLVDNLSIRYFEKRNYLKGYLTYLRELQSRGIVEIIREQRLWGGSYFIEGYSLVIWRPK
jgi:hypothetical protein